MSGPRTAAAALVAVGAWFSASLAQPPAPPPINPAAARLDQTLNGLDGPGFAVAYREDDGLLVVACEKGTLQYCRKDVVSGVRAGDAAPHSLPAHHGPVLSVVTCGGLFASAGADGKVLLWGLPDEKVVRTLDAGTVVRALAATADGKTLAGAGDDGTVRLWDATTGTPGPKLTGATDWLLAVAFSPDGKSVAAAGYDGRLRLWDAVTGKLQIDVDAQPPAAPNTPPPAANVVSALAFSPDGKLIAVGGADGVIHLFQTADGKLARSLPGHTSAVSGLAFHPGGGLLASASRDRTVRLWNPAGGQPLKTLEGHNAWVQGIVFVAEGTRLATVGADATLRLWDLTDPMKK